MRITEKGQVTIPIELREEFGFLPHTEIEFMRSKNGELVVRKMRPERRNAKARGESLVAHLKKYSKYVNMTSDEVMALTRGD